MIETINPENKTAWLALRKLDITSTDDPALFGMSPYKSEYQLYHDKLNGDLVEIEDNARMKWGRRLQDPIGYGIAEDLGLKKVRPMPEYIRDPDKRIGSSFDFAIGDDGLLEIKNVGLDAFSRGWLKDGDDVEAPIHIELQVQHQLLVSGRKFAIIGALVGGNEPYIIRREPDLEVHGEILKRVAKFWKRVEAKEPPEPDWDRDAKFIQKMFQKADGDVLDASEDHDLDKMVESYRHFASVESQIKADKEAMKAQILMRIGEAPKVYGGNYTISCAMTKSAHVEAYDRKPFRMFRVTMKKG